MLVVVRTLLSSDSRVIHESKCFSRSRCFVLEESSEDVLVAMIVLAALNSAEMNVGVSDIEGNCCRCCRRRRLRAC